MFKTFYDVQVNCSVLIHKDIFWSTDIINGYHLKIFQKCTSIYPSRYTYNMAGAVQMSMCITKFTQKHFTLFSINEYIECPVIIFHTNDGLSQLGPNIISIETDHQ